MLAFPAQFVVSDTPPVIEVKGKLMADSDSQKIKENGNAYQSEEKKVKKNRCCMVC